MMIATNKAYNDNHINERRYELIINKNTIIIVSQSGKNYNILEWMMLDDDARSIGIIQS